MNRAVLLPWAMLVLIPSAQAQTAPWTTILHGSWVQTGVHRRYEVQKLASDWGLYYTSHHYDILASNPFGLERFNLAAEPAVSSVARFHWDGGAGSAGGRAAILDC